MLQANIDDIIQNIRTRNKQYDNYPLIIMLLSFLPLIGLFMPNALAQDYTRWHLPEHAILRLGKGGVGDVIFRLMGNGYTPILLSVFGNMMHSQVKNWI